ncbi:MAG TPA: hypothetical protein PLQ36_02210, partial [Candidatus Gracilibacteria bacterium]|nr:hypothetical protein [Candidatus Gracilibacteria bacterium]
MRNFAQIWRPICLLITLVSFWSGVFLLEGVGEYSFANARKLHLPSSMNEYAVARDGTLIQRIHWQGKYQDFILRIIDDKLISFPLDGNTLRKAPAKADAIGGLTNFSANLSTPDLGGFLLTSVLLVLVLVCSWQGLLNRKFKELLLSLDLSRIKKLFWITGLIKLLRDHGDGILDSFLGYACKPSG